MRIDDQSEAAKSSTRATLGIKNDIRDIIDDVGRVGVSVGGGLFMAFQETPIGLQANPSALSRSTESPLTDRRGQGPGFGRKLVEKAVHASDSEQGKSREVIELEYEDAGPNVNGRSAFIFPPIFPLDNNPPPPPPGFGY